MELRRELKARSDELEKTISHYSAEIGKLNAIIIELEKNRAVFTHLINNITILNFGSPMP